MQCNLGEQLARNTVTSLSCGKWCETDQVNQGFHCAISYHQASLCSLYSLGFSNNNSQSLCCLRIKFTGQGLKKKVSWKTKPNQIHQRIKKSHTHLFLNSNCVNLKSIWDFAFCLTLLGFPKALLWKLQLALVIEETKQGLTQGRLCRCCEQMCRRLKECAYLVLTLCSFAWSRAGYGRSTHSSWSGAMADGPALGNLVHDLWGSIHQGFDRRFKSILTCFELRPWPSGGICWPIHHPT